LPARLSPGSDCCLGQAWQGIPDPVARQAFARQRLLPWFDLEAMLWRREGPRLAVLPPARRAALRRDLGEFLLAGLARLRPVPGWRGQITAGDPMAGGWWTCNWTGSTGSRPGAASMAVHDAAGEVC